MDSYTLPLEASLFFLRANRLRQSLPCPLQELGDTSHRQQLSILPLKLWLDPTLALWKRKRLRGLMSLKARLRISCIRRNSKV